MVSQKSKYWFVPRKNLFVSRKEARSFDGAELQLANSPVIEGDRKPVEVGSPFTVLLKSFYVTKDVDPESNNDLLVRSWSKYGESPQIETVHFIRRNVPEKEIIKKKSLVAEHILSKQSYQDQNLVWLKLQIVDIEGKKIKDEIEEIQETFQVIAKKFGGVFPGLSSLPGMFSFAEKKVASIAEKFDEVRNAIGGEKDRNIYEESLDLCSIDSGETPFCYGTYIIFDSEVNGSKYRLKEYELHAQNSSELIHQYAIFEVIPEVTNPHLPESEQEDIILNQHLASGSLLSVEDGDDNSQQIKRFEHLQGLMKKAIQFDEVLELKELERLKVSSLTESKKRRLQKLSRKVGKYIDFFDEIF